jgi:hypothetical protein
VNDQSTLAIRLPAGHALNEDDLELLRTACEALVGLACGENSARPAQVAAMKAEGWQVRYGLTWIARAEKGRQYEEATGSCRGEALCRLCELTGLSAVDGCP